MESHYKSRACIGCNIKKFAKDIGFVDNIKASRKSIYWYGTDKNIVLKKLLKTYNYNKSFWDKFRKKEDIIKFLHTA